MTNRALIISAGGFVGPYLEKVLSGNSYDVFERGYILEHLHERENYFQVHITKNNDVNSVFEQIKPNVIFYLAAK